MNASWGEEVLNAMIGILRKISLTELKNVFDHSVNRCSEVAIHIDEYYQE
jgi:hypothetical protein